MLLNQLEEPHQLVLLRQPQALVLEDRRSRVRHVHQFLPTLFVHEAGVNAFELHVLAGSGSQHEIDGLIGAEKNPRPTQVYVELSGMFFDENVRGMGRNVDVRVDRPGCKGYDAVIVVVGRAEGRRGRRGRMGIEEGGEVVEGEGGEV